MVEKKLSRRTFLKGAAATAVGATAGIGFLSACAGNEAEESVAQSATATAQASESAAPAPEASAEPVEVPPQATASTDTTYGRILNPQEDFTADSGDYSALFEPLTIGHVTLKSRIVKSCAGSELQKSKEWPDRESMSFYEQFCQGGVGMVCYEPSTIFPGVDSSLIPLGDGQMIDAGFAALDLISDDNIPAHKAVADTMHEYGVVVIAQMLDMMMTAGGGGGYAASHKLETSFNPGIVQSREAVHQQQQYFIDAAVRYYKAGFDGVELNCSCNHYFSSFLSRISNNERSDEYSGETIENRARIVTEIIEAIREQVGEDFIIQVLYSAIEDNVADLGDNSLCITIEEACEMARLFEKAGASCLHVRAQAYGHHSGGFMPDVFHAYEHGDTGYNSVIDYGKHFGGLVNGEYDGAGALIEVAGKIKESVSIPIGTVGAMDPRLAPDLITNAIKDGKVDYILMTRILMSDPAIANKLQEGRRDEIAPCTHCMTCFVAPYGLGMPMYCRVNPAISRAWGEEMPEGYDPLPAETPKKVMVIGGGPAGMEAAHIAAQRGHRVSLYEKSGELGGRMNFAQIMKGPHERMDDHRDYLRRKMEVNGVDIHLNTEADSSLVQSEGPDAVIVASGGLMNAMDGLAADVLTMDDVRSQLDGEGELSLGSHIVIIGGQFQACDVATYFARRGKTISLLNPGPEDELYMNAAVWPKLMGKNWLMGKGVKMYHQVRIEQAGGGRVTFATEYGTTQTLSCDSIIQALPLQTNRELFDNLSDICDEVYAVGDCYSPNNIANAIVRANIIARNAGAGATTQASEALADNQYSATASGYGEVRVTITVEDGKITAAVVDTSDETAGIGKDLGEQFAQQILSGGDIDTVSGATMTSNGVKAALEECLAAAGLN